MTAHTPGPWKAIHWNAAGPEIDNPKESPFVVTFPRKVDLLVELNANARLIATAPDLLEAAQNVLSYYNLEKSLELSWMTKLRTAITKATL